MLETYLEKSVYMLLRCLYSEGERSERASAASEVSGAMELQRHGVNRYVFVSVSFAMQVQRHGVNFSALPVHCQDRFILRGYSQPRRAQDAPKTLSKRC